ncbi:MAG: ABC transporter substrate-binding protein [Chloroflexi bacterium]|nr:ABC transporter substrate-binding protein [Chloroflexota bacterium]
MTRLGLRTRLPIAHRWPILLALCFLLIAGIACGESSTSTPAPTPTPALFPLTVVDTNGAVVTFDEPPTRIVAYDAITVEILYAIGEEERIVGTHDFVTYPPEVESVPKLGDYFQPNTERIVEAQPDLVSIWFSSAVPELERLGLKVLYMDEPASVEGIPERIRTWGRITGSIEEAEVVAERFEIRVQELLGRLASLEEGPRVFHDSSDFFTPGPDTIVGQVYSLLKAQNIAHDVSGYGQLSIETIVERDPQVIITTFPDRPPAILSHPALQDVSAVKEGRVVTIDPGLISVAGPRYVEAMEELARLIYPDLFP